jgi:hypothetical protein
MDGPLMAPTMTPISPEASNQQGQDQAIAHREIVSQLKKELEQ